MFKLAESLVNRLTYSRKFLLIGGIAALVIVALNAVMFNNWNNTLRSSENERVGIAYVQALRQVIDNLQQHRGAAGGVLGGDASMRPKLAERQQHLEEALKGVDAVDARHRGGFKAMAQWKTLGGKVRDLKSGVLNITRDESLTRHNALIEELIRYTQQIADESELTLDPEMATYYLMSTAVFRLPTAIESLGKMRATGTGIIARKSITDEEKVMMRGYEMVSKQVMAEVTIELGKVGNAAPSTAARLLPLARDLEAGIAVVRDFVTKEIVTGRFDVSAPTYFAKATEATTAGYRQFDQTLVELDSLLAERVARLKSEIFVSTGAALFALFLLGYLFVGMYRSVRGTVEELSRGAAAIAAGDLTVRIDVRTKDELGEVADSFNRAAAALQDTLKKVMDGAHEVSTAATQMASASSQITQSARTQSESASSTAAAVEEVTVSIGQVAETTRETKSVSEQACNLSTEGEKTARETASQMVKTADSVGQSMKLIENLSRRSNEISGIVKVIRDIAEQTNLLALNAAIEAARAGEQGRGFAVVADEVRKLAERTSSSTSEIAGMIEAIQGEVRSAVDNLKANNEQVAQGKGLAEEVAAILARINEGARTTMQRIHDISSAANEQTTASTDIAKNVEKIAQMTEETSAAIGQASSAAHQLEDLASKLHGEVAKFRT